MRETTPHPINGKRPDREYNLMLHDYIVFIAGVGFELPGWVFIINFIAAIVGAFYVALGIIYRHITGYTLLCAAAAALNLAIALSYFWHTGIS